MNFNVLWTAEAFAAIARIIDRSTAVDELALAVRLLDEQLKDSPGTIGESRPDGQRITFVPPLGVLYEIYWRLNEVVVVDIWKYE